MASETTVSRLGLKQGNADNLELFLKKFAGEVLTTFETENVFKPLHLTRTIESGKSAQFPVTGTATAKYHSPGDNMLLAANSYINSIAHTEKVITIDGLLTSSTFISKIDEAMNHYDVRSIYTTELGRALAKKFDTTIAKVVTLASRASANISGGKAGSFINVASLTPSGADLAEDIYSAAQKLDENDVPSEERYCVLSPANYYKLVQALAAVGNANAVGSYVDGSVVRVAGVQIIKSNNLPSTNVSSSEGNNGGYIGNFTNTVGVVFHKNAVGTVKLLDLAVENEYKIELQGNFMVAKYAMGHGILRPECAVELFNGAARP
jgi:hypothetical protein